MRLARYVDIDEFAARVEPYLLAHEATHCLMLGLLSTLPRGPMPADEIPYMALVEDAGAVVLVAMRTPPFNVILSLIAPEHAAEPSVPLRLIAGDLWSRYRDSLSGVHASAPVSRIFAERWQQQAHVAARLAMRERIYELETVIPISGVSGSYRRPTEADRDLLVRWLEAFAAEALGPIERLDAVDWVDRYFATPSRGGYLWEDAGMPVSFAAYGNPTARGIRIGPVYTPSEQRGRGYASACVATVSQHLLESGRSFCYLFTDLANPTSNHIYQKIGYNPVNDVDVYEFEMER
jgi:predicted GNAT family acetyltransferase